MKAKPIGMLWIMPAEWRNRLPGVSWRAPEALPEGRLAHGMNIYTLLDDAVGGFAGGPAAGWVGEDGRRHRLAGRHDPSGGRRLLFGVGEGPAEAGAEAKQGCIGNADRLRSRERLVWKSRLVEVVPFSRESASFLRQSPVVNHLSFTCRSTC